MANFQKAQITEDEQPKKRGPAEIARSKFLSYLNKEGPYKYCCFFKEIENKPDSFIQRSYGLARGEVIAILNGVFGQEYAYQETIETFLDKVKTIPFM